MLSRDIDVESCSHGRLQQNPVTEIDFSQSLSRCAFGRRRCGALTMDRMSIRRDTSIFGGHPLHGGADYEHVIPASRRGRELKRTYSKRTDISPRRLRLADFARRRSFDFHESLGIYLNRAGY